MLIWIILFWMLILLPPITTIIVPKRFFGRYVVLLGIIFLLLAIAQMVEGGVDSGAPADGIGTAITLILFVINALIVGIKYIILLSMKNSKTKSRP